MRAADVGISALAGFDGCADRRQVVVRRPDPQAEVAEEAVAVGASVKSDQQRSADGQVDFVVECAGAGGERAAGRCRELDAPHAAIAIPRILQLEGREELFGIERVVGQRGVGRKTADAMLGAVGVAPEDAANLVAVPSDRQVLDPLSAAGFTEWILTGRSVADRRSLRG